MYFEELIFEITDADAARIVGVNGVVFPIERTTFGNNKEIEWSVPSHHELPRNQRDKAPYWGVVSNSNGELFWKHPFGDLFNPTPFDPEDKELIATRAQFNAENNLTFYAGADTFMCSIDWAMIGANNSAEIDSIFTLFADVGRVISIDRYFPLGFEKPCAINRLYPAQENFIVLSPGSEASLREFVRKWLETFIANYEAAVARDTRNTSRLLTAGPMRFYLAAFLVDMLVPDPALVSLLYVGIEAVALENEPLGPTYAQSKYQAYLNDLWNTSLFRNAAVVSADKFFPDYWDTKSPDLQ